MGKKSKDVARYNIADRYADGAAEREKTRFPFPTAESVLAGRGISGGAFSEVHTAAPRATEAAGRRQDAPSVQGWIRCRVEGRAIA